MTILLPGQPVHLRSREVEDKVSQALVEQVHDLERRYSPLFEDIRVWWRNYEAIPLKRRKDFPFANSSNVVVPLAQVMVDALVARMFAAVFSHGHRVWDSRTENESNHDLAKNMVRYENWQADGNDFSFKPEAHDWFLEFIAIGASVIGGNWREDQRHTFIRQGRGTDRRINAIPVRYRSGPLLEHIPREQILWDTAFRVHDAPLIVRELRLSWSELIRRAQADPKKSWNLEAIEEARGRTGQTGPSQIVKREKDTHDSKSNTAGEDNKHDIREIHADWPTVLELGLKERDLDIESTFVPLVFTIHMKTKRILRVVGEPYFAPYKPFFDGFYKKRAGRGHSVGAVKKLEQLQNAITTMFNQGIDAQTRANAIWAKTKVRRHLEQPIDPSVPIWDPDMQGFEPLKIPGSDFGNIQLIQLAQAMSERLTGQADPAFGRETRLGGHPAPATNTLALLANSDLLNGPMRDLTAESIGRMGEFVAILDQQFESDEDGKINRTLGEQDGELVKNFLFPTEPIPGNYQFNVRGLSRDLNPDQAMNRAVQVAQMNQSYWAFVHRATQAITQLLQVQLPPQIQQANLQAWGKSIQAQTKAHLHFLDAADIDDAESFVLSLEQGERNARRDLQDFSNRAREGALLGARPGQSAGTAVPRSAGNGAAGPVGSAGGPPFSGPLG